MITVEEIMKSGKKQRRKEDRQHKHEFVDEIFNIEGHKVRGKICKECSERFFLGEDLIPIEHYLRAKYSKSRTISIEDAILLLAGTYPEIEIPGTLVIQKEMFLFEKSFAPETRIQVEPLDFEPYHMGPFSRKLRRVLARMRREGLLEFRPLRGREGTAYKLTEKGKRLARERSALVPSDVQKDLRARRRAWDELGSHGLLRLVYRDFGAYASRSRIKEQVERGPGHEN